jgi:hypothetical protein
VGEFLPGCGADEELADWFSDKNGAAWDASGSIVLKR